MHATFRYPVYPYQQSLEQQQGRPSAHPVVIVGAGPIGLAAALECARRGIACVLLDDNNTVSNGSRAVCHAKRALEIYDRLGVASRIVEKGISWKVGRVFFGKEQVYSFDLLPEPGHKMPAMINLQQYYLEQFLVEACQAQELIELRWKHKVVALSQDDRGVQLTVETPDGQFSMLAGWVLACDGANSSLRRMVGAGFNGQAFHDRFLIADVVMKKADFPTERWYWFDPPFHPGQSVLLHRQADDVWRIDFQLGAEADPEREKAPDRVIPRIRAMLGPDVPFELEWVSVYQFACRRIDNMRHGRVLFAGDSAHQVSPFGARGANSGVQDVDNLVWKLQMVLQGHAGQTLLDSYHHERAMAADDNIGHSTRSTDFITPRNEASRILRNAALQLAKREAFARRLINSGRLSMPTPYTDSPLNTPDDAPFAGTLQPGCNCADAPVRVHGRPGWLLDALPSGFSVLVFGQADARELELDGLRVPVLCVGRDLEDDQGLLVERYDGQPGTTYLIRPDHYIAGRWRRFDEGTVRAALARACARELEERCA